MLYKHVFQIKRNIVNENVDYLLTSCERYEKSHKERDTVGLCAVSLLVEFPILFLIVIHVFLIDGR